MSARDLKKSVWWTCSLCWVPLLFLMVLPTSQAKAETLPSLAQIQKILSEKQLPPYRIENETIVELLETAKPGETPASRSFKYDNIVMSDGVRSDLYTTSYTKEADSWKAGLTTQNIWDGGKFLHSQNYETWKQPGVSFSKDARKAASPLFTNEAGAFLSAIMVQKPPLDYISQAHNVTIAAVQGKAEVAPLMSVTGDSPYGHFVFVMDSVSLAIHKAQVLVKAGDQIYDGKLPMSLAPDDPNVPLQLIEEEVSIEINDEQMVEGRLVPQSAVQVEKRTFNIGVVDVFNRSCKITHTQWNPDFAALGAFKLKDIPEGTRVTFSDQPTVPYVWHDGEPVPKPLTHINTRVMDDFLRGRTLQK